MAGRLHDGMEGPSPSSTPSGYSFLYSQILLLNPTLKLRYQRPFQYSPTALRTMARVKRRIAALLLLSFFQAAIAAAEEGERIPTTLDGPFRPATRRFDPSLRRGSDDLPMDSPRLAKKVRSPFPEQIALASSYSPTSMWVSWVTGDAQIGKNVTPIDPSTVASEVWFGEESGKYSSVKRGTATVYSQLYPFEGLLNYTSAIIHHVRLDVLTLLHSALYQINGDHKAFRIDVSSAFS